MRHVTRLRRRDALRGLAALALASLALPGRLAAHPLPGAVLVLARDKTRLTLAVSVALSDLALGMGDRMPPELQEAARISPATEQALAAYFADRMALVPDGQPALDLQLTRVWLERATQEDVGAYTLVRLDFSAPLKTGSPAVPMTLTYDAVMHEVRNHTAAVYVQSTAAGPVGIGVIRLDSGTGAASPLVIPALP